jgi:putative heme-binding domain-containing protein
MRLVLLLAACLAGAQTRTSNPYSSATDVAAGKRMYSFYCVNCHGMDGASGRGARLASKFRRFGTSDREMYQTIANGIPGSEMPGQWLDEDSLWKILAFVRTLEADPPAVCASNPEAAARGKQVYATKGCAACHTTGMGGGRLGPDLTTIGATHTRQYLLESLDRPEAVVAPRYRMIQLEMRDGQTVEGVLLNEDDYSIHLMDRGEQLRSFLKEETGSITRGAGSLMPSYRGAMNGQERADLADYMCSLKGGTR